MKPYYIFFGIATAIMLLATVAYGCFIGWHSDFLDGPDYFFFGLLVITMISAAIAAILQRFSYPKPTWTDIKSALQIDTPENLQKIWRQNRLYPTN